MTDRQKSYKQNNYINAKMNLFCNNKCRYMYVKP